MNIRMENAVTINVTNDAINADDDESDKVINIIRKTFKRYDY